MVEFFKKLAERPGEDPLRDKVLYLTALLLMRKRRVKPVGTRRADDRRWILLEKAWDGDTVEIPDPPISDEELHRLRAELERLFDLELAAEAPRP